MLEFLKQLATNYPLIIFIASVLDIFFVSGLFLYGAAMMGSILMLYTAGLISVSEIILASYAGTLLGNILNYWSGRVFDKVPIVDKKLNHPKVQTAKGYLRTKGLFLYILICRFIAISRPLYALVLGSLNIKFSRFIVYEAVVAFFWVVFWLIVLIQGEVLFRMLFS